MRSAVVLCACVIVLVASVSEARRVPTFGSRRGGYKPPKAPSPPRRPPQSSPPKPSTSSSGTFLNAERGGASGTTHNRGSQFTPSAPQPQHPHTSSQQHNTNGQPHNTNGPIGFEGINNANNKGHTPIGFDNVNSQAQNRPVGGNSPPYPAGPPPAYPGTSGTSHGGYEHPPSYPGRPVNAPPTYQQNTGSSYPGQHSQYPGQTNQYPGQHSQYPGQTNQYPGQHSQYPGQTNQYHGQHSQYPGQANQYPGQQNPYPGQYNPYPGQYNPYHGQQTFGGSNQHGYSSYPGNNGYHPPGTYSYPGATYSGSPFAGGYNGNPHYGPQNFGYSGYPGQYQQQSGSRFGGLPIPIPIPIPIPLGGGGLFGGHSHNHQLMDSFIQSKKENNSDKSTAGTSVFLLNNSTVAPCTTDHYVYDLMTVTVVSCTAENCAAIKLSAHTNTTKETVHSASVTMCLGYNVTASTHGSGVTPTLSPIVSENTTVCRDVPSNVTVTVAAPNTTQETTTSAATTEPATVTTTEPATTTVAETTTVVASPKNDTNTTRLCETVTCWTVEMCMPTIEVLDACPSDGSCPFRRTGYTSCVKVKMCRSPTVPFSTTATLNNTVSKIDEFNHFNSVHDIANLTLIAYHRPVISFNCTQGVPAPGCPAPPAASTAAPTVATTVLPVADNTTTVATDTTTPTTTTPPQT